MKVITEIIETIINLRKMNGLHELWTAIQEPSQIMHVGLACWSKLEVPPFVIALHKYPITEKVQRSDYDRSSIG